MYELYLNGNKVKQINYIGEHDYTPVVEQVETPMITYTDQQYAEGDCNFNRFRGDASVDITCDTVGATIYYRYGLCTVDEYCNPTPPDLTNEPWVVFDSLSIQNTGTNVCDDGTQWWYVEAYATKSGMDDSSVSTEGISISADEGFDCYDCNNWQEIGYTSYEDCDCQVNGNCVDCNDCSNWEECGYSSYEDCDCQVNGNCTDCDDCSNWAECGFESYEDCDCQVNGNCE